MADYDARGPNAPAAAASDGFSAMALDASDQSSVAALIEATRCDAVLNAVDPRFVMPVFGATLAAGATYVDMAMSLSHPHPRSPARADGREAGRRAVRHGLGVEERGLLALAGMGVEPGLSDVFARYAADELFSSVEEVGIRDGANLVVDGLRLLSDLLDLDDHRGVPNPPVVWEKGRGWFTTAPFSEPETFVFPEGIGPVECVNVEHEEVLLVPRWVDAGRVTFKYGLGDEFIDVLADPPHPRTRLDRPGEGRRGRGGAARRGGRLPPRPGGDRPPHARPHLRRHLGEGHRPRRRPARGLPAPRGRQRLVDGRVQLPGGGLADGGQPRVALELVNPGPGRGPVYSAPRRFRPEPFLDLVADCGAPWGVEERAPG